MGVHQGAAVVAVGGGTVCIFARPTVEDAFHQAPDDVPARVVDVLNLAVGNPSQRGCGHATMSTGMSHLADVGWPIGRV